MVEVKGKGRTRTRYLSDIRIYGQRGLMLWEYYEFYVTIPGIVSERFAFKLREHAFSLPDGMDHFYIRLSPDYPGIEIIPHDCAEPRILSIRIPLKKEDVPNTYPAQFKFLVDLIVFAFEKVSTQYQLDLDLVKRTAADVLSHGNDFEITQCSDENDRFRVAVVFQIRDDKPRKYEPQPFDLDDLPDPYHVFLTVLDKSTGALDKRFLFTVSHDSEVFELFHKVKVSRSAARIISKTSWSAKRTLEKYASTFKPKIDL